MLSWNWCKKQITLHNKNNDTKCYDLMGMKNNELEIESDTILEIWNKIIDKNYTIFSKDYDVDGKYTIIQFII